MSSKRYVLGIDNGGTVIKAAIYDEAGTILALDQAHVHNLTPAPLQCERDMEELWQANARAIRRCLAASKISAEDIAALSITGHGNGIYLAKKDGSPARPGVISTDARAQSYVSRWLADPQVIGPIRARTGSSIWAGQPTALLAWFEEHEPELFDRTDYVFFCKDYIRYRLTGQARIDRTDATGVGVVDLASGEYDQHIFDLLGIGRWSAKFPPMCEATDIAGYVSEEAAALTGLKAGTPVAGGVMDVAAGALAAGLSEENELCLISGTWSINQILTRTLRTKEEVFMTIDYPIPEVYLVLEASPNGVANLDWYIKNVVRKTLESFGNAPLTDAEVFRICEEMIHDFEPSLEDPFFLPYINSTPILREGGAGFIGLLAIHDIRHMVRAVYEGVIFSHLWHIDNLANYTHVLPEVRFTGGAANSPMWVQMFADGLARAVNVVDAEESGTLGAAICSAVAAGVHPDITSAMRAMTNPPRATFHPSDKYRELFAARYARFKEYLEAGRP